MFDIGQRIVYGQIGVCRVQDIQIPDFCAGEKKQYYVLEPENQRGSIFIPVDSEVYMRPILTKEEADELIDLIPTLKTEAYHSTSLQELTQHYATALHSHNATDVIEMIMSIYAKKQIREKNNQKIGAVDEGFMRRAEELLYSELALALGIDREAVPDYISDRVREA